MVDNNSESGVISFTPIFWGHSDGTLTIDSKNKVLIWHSKYTEFQKKISASEIESIVYNQLGKRCHLKIALSQSKKRIRFTNLRRKEIAVINQLMCDVFKLPNGVTEELVNSSGGNWGDMVFDGDNLSFRIPKSTQQSGDDDAKDDDSTQKLSSSMEIPLGIISQCALPGKNEVELQFHEDDTVAGDEETLVEMRLYVPPGDNEDRIFAEKFKSEVLERANISTVTGKAIVELDETMGTFLTPRGRYAVELYGTFLRMHGKTYDYKIMYANINRCFLLERPDGISTAFVISLEEPIRQGKQGYPHLVMQLRNVDVHLDVHLSPEQLKAYNGNLHERMSGQLPQLVATLFKFIMGKKVYTSGKFTNHNQDRAIKCALKAQEGLLFPLEKSFMFIHKPTTFIRYEDIMYIEFQRYAGQAGSTASRNFDLLVSCRQVGNEPAREFLFAAIDRREFPELSQFLSSKKSIKIRKLAQESSNVSSSASAMRSNNTEEGEIDEDEDDEEDDSDFGPGEEESDSDFSSSGEEGGEDDGTEDTSAKRKKKDKKQKQKKRSKHDA